MEVDVAVKVTVWPTPTGERSAEYSTKYVLSAD